MKTVIFGVTGGIAAYQSVELIKMLRKENITVFVIMTKAAARMVNPKEFENVSGNKVYLELFEENFDYKAILQIRKVDHIDLADKADVFVIAPATANIIAKIANGLADDFLTTTLLASSSPVILCPSMNVHMWRNPITQENIKKLKRLGFIIIPPEHGMLACGYEGSGRLAHLQTIKDEVMKQLLYTKTLAGKKILVTAGGTEERIDAARVITNRSSGKMGIALAEECYLRGADVLLFRAATSVAPKYPLKEELFDTSEDLSQLLEKHITSCDVLFHTAAVSDFTIKDATNEKISSQKPLSLRLVPQKKIISQIKTWNPKIMLIACKAEVATDEDLLVKKARSSLRKTNADVVIANDISQKDRGFQSDTNEVFVVTKETNTKISLRSKQEIAKAIIHMLIVSLPQKP